MADGDVNVKVKLGADISGGVQSREEMKKIRAEAKAVGNDTAAGASRAKNGMAGFQRSVGLVRKALTGFGVVGLFTGLVAGISKISGSFDAARKKAEEFEKAADARALAKSIEDLAESYDRLKTSIATASKAEKDSLEVIDMEVKARRELQDEKINAAEQDELASVDPDAVDAAEQRQAIAAKYNRMRSTNAASNRTEDLVLQRQKLTSAAETNDAEAKAAEGQAEALAKKARQLRGLASGEEVASISPNEKDKVGFLNYVGGNIHDLFSGNWGNLTSFSTEAGDAEREKHRQRQDDLNKQAEALEKQSEAMKLEAEAKKAEAEQNRKRATALNGSVEAAQLASETTKVKSDLEEKDAARAIVRRRDEAEKEKERKDAEERRKAAEKARQEKELADARALLSGGDARAESLRSRIDANNRQITATSFQVASGSMGSDAGARVVAELQSQNTSLNELLTALLRQIEQSKRVIERANERARNSSGVDDSSEGA